MSAREAIVSGRLADFPVYSSRANQRRVEIFNLKTSQQRSQNLASKDDSLCWLPL